MEHDEDKGGARVTEEEGPPFGGSWRALYAVVLLWLLAQVLLFYLFTEAFR